MGCKWHFLNPRTLIKSNNVALPFLQYLSSANRCRPTPVWKVSGCSTRMRVDRKQLWFSFLPSDNANKIPFKKRCIHRHACSPLWNFSNNFVENTIPFSKLWHIYRQVLQRLTSSPQSHSREVLRSYQMWARVTFIWNLHVLPVSPRLPPTVTWHAFGERQPKKDLEGK